MALKPYLDLCRISNLPTVWTNVLAAALLTTPSPPWPAVVTLVLSMSFFYCGGMSLNDIIDLPHDRLRKPLRPLPSGAIRVGDAWICTISLFLIAVLLLCLGPNVKGILGGMLLLAAIVGYDAAHKRHASSVILMASCRLMIYVTVSLSLAGKVAPLAFLAGVLQFCYIIAISITARYENSRPHPFAYPVIPLMLSAISLLDGLALAVLLSPAWVAVGGAGTAAMLSMQKLVRGD